MSASDWSDDRVTTLSRLWLDGLSASQIAKQLGGVTRNAVIGKVHRLGISARGVPAQPRAMPARTPKPRSARLSSPARSPRPPAGMAEVPAPVEGPGLVTSMAALGAHACKWPIGDPKASGFTFCGQLTDTVYCRAHAALAYRPGSARALDRDPQVRRLLMERAA
jgi:GcrA cell cycle regulator